MIHLIQHSYKYYHLKYLFFLLLGLYSSTILGSHSHEPLTRNQLQEKLDKYEETFQKCSESLESLRSMRRGSNQEDRLAFIDISSVLLDAGGIVIENVHKLREQIKAYDEGNHDISSNNQHNNANNSDHPLPDDHSNIPLYLKIIIGIVAASLVSLLSILIWESLPKKKKKKTKKDPFSPLQKPKSAQH